MKTSRYFLSKKEEKVKIKQAKKFIDSFSKQNGITLSELESGPTYINHDLSLFLIRTDSINEKEFLNFVIHELAHFAVSNPEERKAINYGLGKGISCEYHRDETKEWERQFSTTSIDYSVGDFSHSKTNQIECHAIMVHALFTKPLGFAVDQIFDYFNFFIIDPDESKHVVVSTFINEVNQKMYQVSGQTLVI